MMADVAENEPPAQQPGPRPPSDNLPAVHQPALPAESDAPTPPRDMDMAEYQRFQEFQRFQDYQRFVQGQQGPALPAPIPPQQPPGELPPRSELESQLVGMRQQLSRIERVTNPPTWQKILRNKWLHRLIWLVIIIALATWGVPKLVHHYLGGSEPSADADKHPGEIQGSGRLAPDVKDAVAAVYHIVAESPPDIACLEFSPAARTTFGHDLSVGVGGRATCREAVRAINAKLGPAGIKAYTNVQIPDDALHSTDHKTVQISSCDIPLVSGPHLGLFMLTQQGTGDWLITGHSNEPNPCPAPTTTSAPPTS
jgi:hypothetical protein